MAKVGLSTYRPSFKTVWRMSLTMGEKTQANVGYWQLLKNNQRFRQLWIAQIVSELGDWLNLVALFQIIKQFSGSAQDTGWLVILQMLPLFILSSIS